jgi:hypothetical protein
MVRFMRPSVRISNSWFHVFAEQAARLVPTVTAARLVQEMGVPAMKYPADVDATTRALRRALDSSIYIPP